MKALRIYPAAVKGYYTVAQLQVHSNCKDDTGGCVHLVGTLPLLHCSSGWLFIGTATLGILSLMVQAPPPLCVVSQVVVTQPIVASGFLVGCSGCPEPTAVTVAESTWTASTRLLPQAGRCLPLLTHPVTPRLHLCVSCLCAGASHGRVQPRDG
jgi:hypothetical protein